MKEIDRSTTIYLLYARSSLTVTSNFRSQQNRITIPVSITFLTTASPYIVYTQTDFNFSQVLPTTQRLQKYLLVRQFHTLVLREYHDCLSYQHISYTPSHDILIGTYYPCTVKLCRPSVLWLTDLVRLLDSWYTFPMGSMVTSPRVKQYLTWCSFTLRCLILALCLQTVAIYKYPMLSLKTLHMTLGVVYYIGNISFLNSFRICIIGITSLSGYDSPVYSDSVLDSIISVYNQGFHMKGHAA